MVVVKKTSSEWQCRHVAAAESEQSKVGVVMDPDGWDRSNLQYSWFEELITEEEFIRRRGESTCIFEPVVKGSM